MASRPFWAPYQFTNPFFTDSIHEIDSSITQLQHVISMFPRSDPRRLRSMVSLASLRGCRYRLSNETEDIDKGIVHHTESILLPPPSWLQHGPLILRILFGLSISLALRSNVTKQPEDAITATKFLFHLRHQPHEIPTIPRHKVTESLVKTLAWQVELEAGNVMQNIREIAILSRELLTVEKSDIDTTQLIDLIWEVVGSNYDDLHVPDLPADELIEFLREAMKRRPDRPQGRAAFALSLVYRYYRTNGNDDYEEAMSILDEMTTSRNSQDKTMAFFPAFATGLASFLAELRSSAHWSPEYLEEAIHRTRTCRDSSYTEFFSAPRNPEASAENRFLYFGSIQGVEEPSVGPLVPLPDPETPEFDEPFYKMCSISRVLIHNDGDVTKIDEAIKKGRSIAASSHDAYDELALYLFGEMLFGAFGLTKKIKYLNESISTGRQMLKSPVFSSIVRLRRLFTLSNSLLARSHWFPGYSKQDLNEGLELATQCVNDARAGLPDRLRLAFMWTLVARYTRHSSVSTAYETALSLIQDSLLFAPTLQLQHFTLAMDEDLHRMPLDYVSYLVDLRQLEQAIETLERGRALLWSEMRRLRVSVDQLLEADPELGRKFAAVNRDLEELTKSVSPTHKLSMDDAAADNLRAVDPFGRLVLKQRGLLKERAKLISQIQVLPGFDSFLTSPSFETLRSAALSGPVIIINHSRWRSDILILLHDMPPSLISNPYDFYDRATALKDKLLDSRRYHGLDSKDYDDTLAFVLAELYNLIGQPIIDRLCLLQVPEQSRIWWCTTSVFGSLPLHAMGPIPSDDGETRYFLDLYICSYTPTLDALIQSRHHDSSSRSSDRPSILLVAQPDPSLPTVGGEIQAVQALDTKVTSLIAEAATPITVIDCFHHHRFVHFACHGKLEAGKPFEAGFELYGNARLTLLEIVRAHLPTAEFAFLSACHTAEVTEGSMMDEGLHLAAAVQYCGFRSVVGTMWAMVDEDGRDLAKHFYKALFSNPRGIPHHERSAKALRFAVKKLRRKKGISLERWVNFVHYGA
jgi:CHAT domain-containing protein